MNTKKTNAYNLDYRKSSITFCTRVTLVYVQRYYLMKRNSWFYFGRYRDGLQRGDLFSIKLLVLGMSVLMSACNSGQLSSAPSAKNTLSSKLKSLTSVYAADIDIVWTVDNVVPQNSLNSSLRDMGWHLVTMSVSRVGEGIKPIAVGGLLAGIYPTPSPNVGQNIEIQDVNCNSAIFTKAGDSCSAYFRLKYDLNKGTTKAVTFPIEMAPKSTDLAAYLTFTAKVDPTISIADYRFANRAENKYYGSEKLAGDKYRYQVQVVENGSLFPVSITTLQIPTNPLFKVVHRVNSTIDPYYGEQAECSTNENTTLKQIYQLKNLTESCITIYQAATTSTVAKATESLQVTSNASYFFPTWNNKYKLMANYVNANPEQPQTISGNQMQIVSGNAHSDGSAMIMDSNGTLEYIATTKNQVNAVTVNDVLRPQAPSSLAVAPVINQSGNKLYYDPISTSAQALPVNVPLFVSSNDNKVTTTTVIRVGEIMPNGTLISGSSDNGCTKVSATITLDKLRLIQKSPLWVSAYFYYNEGPQEAYFNGWLNMNPTAGQALASKRQQANTWDKTVYGSYAPWACKTLLPTNPVYCLQFTAEGVFGNLGWSQPHRCSATAQIKFEVNNNNYEDLSTPVAPIRSISLGGQWFAAGIGQQVNAYTPSFNIYNSPDNGILIAGYRLNAAAGNKITARLGLNAGDRVEKINLDFTRSEGYDLTAFSEISDE